MKCKYCSMEISIEARICPHCRKHPEGNSGRIITAIILILIGCFIVTCLIKKHNEEKRIENIIENMMEFKH